MGSPAFLNCTGPVYVYAYSPSAIVQLGTCEQHPVTETQQNWDDVFNDIGGPLTPFDQQYQGQIELISLDLNRLYIPESFFLEASPFNASLVVPGIDLQSYLGSVITGAQAGTPGASGNAASRGAYLNQNANGFALWLVYSYFGTANLVDGQGLPPGVFYPNCRFMKTIIPQQGTKTMKRRLEIMAFPAFGFDSNGGTTFWTKSSDAAWFTGLPTPV